MSGGERRAYFDLHQVWVRRRGCSRIWGQWPKSKDAPVEEEMTR